MDAHDAAKPRQDDMMFRREARRMMLTVPIMGAVGALMALIVLPILRWLYSN